MIDLTSQGRNERDLQNKMEWVRHHDRYDASARDTSCTAHG